MVVALSLLSIAALPSCSTGKASRTGEAPATAAGSQKAKGLLAKGGETARARYIDPALVSAHSPALVADAAAVGSEEERLPSTENPAGNAMGQGVVTQPTGIRAGTVSIFSGAPTSAAGPAATASVPSSPSGRIDARSGSLFGRSPAAAPAAEDCGTDDRGDPLSC